jgi:hypothetical protein
MTKMQGVRGPRFGTCAQGLAEAGISVFAVSTFDMDHLLVKAADLERAVDILRRRGHTIQGTMR